MAYRLMIQLIKISCKTKEELLNMADVFYAAERLVGEQYTEIVEQIKKIG